MYRGTWDAFQKIVKLEGARGLYRGFWVNAFSVVSGSFYILTYENVRHLLKSLNVNDTQLKALVAGGCASMVGQTCIVPFDVISQRLMMMGLVSCSVTPTRNAAMIKLDTLFIRKATREI